MVKYIYQAVALVFIFAGALFLFGRNMETDMEEKGVTEAITDETYPYLQLQTQGQTVNVLYGYSAPLEANVVRESITPINQNRQISLLISKAKSRLVNVTYSIVDKESGEVYKTGSVNAIGQNQRRVDLTFDYGFKTSTEYILDLKTTSDKGKSIIWMRVIWQKNWHLPKNFITIHFQKTNRKKSAVIWSRMARTGTRHLPMLTSPRMPVW